MKKENTIDIKIDIWNLYAFNILELYDECFQVLTYPQYLQKIWKYIFIIKWKNVMIKNLKKTKKKKMSFPLYY